MYLDHLRWRDLLACEDREPETYGGIRLEPRKPSILYHHGDRNIGTAMPVPPPYSRKCHNCGLTRMLIYCSTLPDVAPSVLFINSDLAR